MSPTKNASSADHAGDHAAGRPADVPSSADLQAVVDAITAAFTLVPDDGWERTAHGLEWDCRDTAAHLCDDFGMYALNLAGSNPPPDDYVQILEPAPWREGSPPMIFWPDPELGTASVVSVVDATGGLLVAVTATAPPGKTGFHPRGNGDASGFAAMGIVEGAAHAVDICTAHGIEFSLDPGIAQRTLNRLFPWAEPTDDPWQEFLRVTGRTHDTRDQDWTWDSSVRATYGPSV